MIPNLYKIGNLTKQLSITPRTIRYYDQIGLLPNIKRSDGDTRLFDDADIEIIKQIRILQKKDYLPLEHIKNKLFSPEELHQNTLIFSDSITNSLSPIFENVSIISLSQKQSIKNHQEEIKKEINIAIKKGKKIFIGFYTPSLETIYTSIKKTLPKTIHFYCYPLKEFTASSYCITKKVTENLTKCTSLKELQLIISRFLKLSVCITVSDSIQHFFKPKNHISPIHQLINNVHPIIVSTQHFISTHSFHQLSPYMSKILYEILEEELIKRKRYQDTITLYTTVNEKQYTSLKQTFPKIQIIQKNKRLSSIYGNKHIILSLI